MGASVLLVEDEPVLGEVLAAALTDAGYAVRTAGSGEAALAEVARERPDAIVSNVMMAGMGGVELVATLRDRGERIPTVLMSAVGEPPGHGAFLFVSKPFDLDHLLAVVERAIGAG